MVFIAYKTEGYISWLNCCFIVDEMNAAVLNDISQVKFPQNVCMKFT